MGTGTKYHWYLECELVFFRTGKLAIPTGIPNTADVIFIRVCLFLFPRQRGLSDCYLLFPSREDGSMGSAACADEAQSKSPLVGDTEPLSGRTHVYPPVLSDPHSQLKANRLFISSSPLPLGKHKPSRHFLLFHTETVSSR